MRPERFFSVEEFILALERDIVGHILETRLEALCSGLQLRLHDAGVRPAEFRIIPACLDLDFLEDSSNSPLVYH